MSGSGERYRVSWDEGPSAQVELFGPAAAGGGYQMKYTPPFRPTIRRPMQPLAHGPEVLRRVTDMLNQVAAKLEGPSRTAEQPHGTLPDESVLQQLEFIGRRLYTNFLARYVRADLRPSRGTDPRTGGLFLEIGLDEQLLNYPWELMYDGQDYLSLKHALGRFVISSSHGFSRREPAPTPVGSLLETLSILIISVPSPQPREVPGSEALIYDKLPEAEAETEAILETLSETDVKPQTLSGRQATYRNVCTALSDGQYQIIHFNGHARFNDQQLYRSGLVLYDGDIETGELAETIGQNPPLLCFVNACETGRSAETTAAGSRLDIFGLARAFLDTGAYLLGSRWKVNDKTASEFARQFYTSLIKDGQSIGKAIVDARKACKEAVPTDVLGWASYVYYGDPRLCFRRLPPATGTASPV